MFFIPSTAGQFLGFYETKVIPFSLSKVGGFLRTKWSKKYFWTKNKRSCFLYPQPPVSFWDLVKKKAKKILKLKINFFFVDNSKTDRRLRVPKVGGFVRTKWSKKYFWKKNKRSCFLYPQPPVSFWDLVKKKAKKISKLKINFFFLLIPQKLTGGWGYQKWEVL
jgi:hypothetical protein